MNVLKKVRDMVRHCRCWCMVARAGLVVELVVAGSVLGLVGSFIAVGRFLRV